MRSSPPEVKTLVAGLLGSGVCEQPYGLWRDFHRWRWKTFFNWKEYFVALYWMSWLIFWILFVSGKRFYAHRIVLLASSDAFRAMFDGGYKVSSNELIWNCIITAASFSFIQSFCLWHIEQCAVRKEMLKMSRSQISVGIHLSWWWGTCLILRLPDGWYSNLKQYTTKEGKKSTTLNWPISNNTRPKA